MNTIKRIEQSEGPVMARAQTIEAITDSFTAHGLTFAYEETRIAVFLEGEPSRRDPSVGYDR